MVGPTPHPFQPAWWMQDAACAGMDQNIFFPSAVDKADALRLNRLAMAVCNGDEDHDACPVQQECLAYAIRNNEKHGVWGGRTEHQRRRDRVRIRRQLGLSYNHPLRGVS